MIQSDSGHIVTIASVAGLFGSPGLTDYNASKFGAVGFDEALRLELKVFNIIYDRNYNLKWRLLVSVHSLSTLECSMEFQLSLDGWLPFSKRDMQPGE